MLFLPFVTPVCGPMPSVRGTVATLAWRNVVRQRRLSVLLAVVAAVPALFTLVVGSVQATATFTGPELASVAMGRADLLARSNSQQGTDLAAPTAASGSGIRRAVRDLDLTASLRLPNGQRLVSSAGRIVPFGDPLTRGIVVTQGSVGGHHQLGLSPDVARRVGVRLGEQVLLGSDRAGVAVHYTDTVEYALDTSQPVFLLDPTGLSPEGLERVVSGSTQIGTARWLIQATDVDLAARYLTRLGYTTTSRAGYLDQSPATARSRGLLLVLATIATLVLAGGAGVATRAQQSQAAVLTRLGAHLRTTASMLIMRLVAVVVPGMVVGAIAGAALTPLVTGPLSERAGQDWGEVSFPVWPLLLYSVVAIAVLIAVSVGLVIRQTRPIQFSARTSPQGALGRILAMVAVAIVIAALVSSGLTPVVVVLVAGVFAIIAGQQFLLHWFTRVSHGLIGRVAARTAGASARSALAGGAAIGLLVMIGSGAALVMAAQRSNAVSDYTARIPRGTVLVGLPRTLTPDQITAVTTRTNSSAFEDRRATFAYDSAGIAVPALLPGSVNGADRYVSVVQAIGSVHTILGRTLTDTERESLVSGDGLLLGGFTAADGANGRAALQSPRGYTGTKPTAVLAPRPVTDAGKYPQLPSLLISAATAKRYGLFAEPVPTSVYLFRSVNQAALDPDALRAALPGDLRDTAALDAEDGLQWLALIDTVELASAAGSTIVAAVLVVLLVSLWAGDAGGTFLSLRRLGISDTQLRRLLTWRSLLALGPTALLGLLASLALAFTFARHAGGAFSMTVGIWVLPALAVPVTVIAATHLLPPRPVPAGLPD